VIFGQPTFIKPACAPVRKENGLYLRLAGETVIASNYWLRRVQAGDVIELDRPTEAEQAPISKSKTKG